jgi:HAD superfamily hydrolase (TIGR01549 family)
MSFKPYLLFDAGGTLVFPDHQYLTEIANDFGVKTTVEFLNQRHCQFVYEIDEYCLRNGTYKSWPESYPRVLFESLELSDGHLDSIITRVKKRDQRKSLWSFTHPWVSETLSKLSSIGYQMAVISNSTGRAISILEELGLTKYFDRVFDSAILGVEKPHRGIFEIALNELNLQPSDALYIGDVFFIDVWGANHAGIGGIHLDPLGLYQSWSGVHIPSVRYLTDWLVNFTKEPFSFDLFPTKDMQLNFD